MAPRVRNQLPERCTDELTDFSFSSIKESLVRKFLCAFLCLLVQPFNACLGQELASANAHNQQTIELLGIGNTVHKKDLASKERTFRKILQAVMEVQSAENRLETELVYATDVLAREERRVSNVDRFFNAANFLQFGVLYTVEPWARIREQFLTSAILTTVGGGVGLLLPTLNILYDKRHKAKDLTPPAYLKGVVEGKPVDGTHLPPLVVRYLNSSPPGEVKTRRELLNELWKTRYHVDMNKPETLCRIDDNKSKKLIVLTMRIELLWSLHGAVQELNRDLLAVVDELSDYKDPHDYSTPSFSQSLSENEQATKLLNLQPILTELNEAPANSDRQAELRLAVLERIVHGYLEMHIARDQCQNELNYQYDVALSDLMARRGKFLQRTFEANFIQTNILGTIAGYEYLKNNGKSGNELFIIADANGLAITTLSLLATRGGHRKNTRPPNSLATFFGLVSPEAGGYSPLAWRFLNVPKPGHKENETRREFLLRIWKQNRVVTVDLDNQHNREQLASMPGCKKDTISLCTNRIALLSSLRSQFDQFDGSLLGLLKSAWAPPEVLAGSNLSNLSPSVVTTAKLLRADGLLDTANSNTGNGLLFDKMVLEGFLDTNNDADVLMSEITVETQVLDRMKRQRDLAIQLTNISNFYQIGILGCVSDSLGLSTKANYVLAGNRINIVSGFLVSNLALLALLERRGFVRPTKPEVNLIASVLNKQPAEPNMIGGLPTKQPELSPTSARYLDLPSGLDSSMSRRQKLLAYWHDSKILNINISKESNIQKLTAEGKGYHWWDESIKLISNRVSMLYDLRAVLRTSNAKFAELLEASM